MVFPAMLCGIAFLGGSLLMLTFIPSIHKRAVRLTTRHIMATEPIGMADIRAERDRSRSQFAVAIRSLEVSVEELKTKCASQAAEVGRRAAKIHSLEAELKERPRQSAELGRQAGEIQRLEAELKKRVDFFKDDWFKDAKSRGIDAQAAYDYFAQQAQQVAAEMAK